MKIEALSEERVKHSFGVAKYMSEHAKEYGVAPDEAFVVGLLHDIGYIYVENEANHEENGADLLQSLGFIYSDEIRAHGTLPSKVFDKIGLDVSPMLELLYNADLSVDVAKGYAGKEVGFDKRIENFGKRRGFDHPNYEECRKIKEELIELKKQAS